MQIDKIEFGSLSEVRGIRRSILKEWFKIPAIMSLLIILFILGGLLYLLNAGAIILIPILVLLFENYVSKKKNRVWGKFAESNGWEFNPAITNSSSYIPNTISKIGVDYSVTNVIKVNTGTNHFDLYNLDFYINGYGFKHYQRHHYTIARISLEKSFPSIVLDSNKTLSLQHKTKQRISLEGNFDKYFSMYIDLDKQVDALSIITPDIMLMLIKFGADYDIEISDKYAYIAIEKNYHSASKVKSLITVAHIIKNELEHKQRTISSSESLLSAQKMDKFVLDKLSFNNKFRYSLKRYWYMYILVFTYLFVILLTIIVGTIDLN